MSSVKPIKLYGHAAGPNPTKVVIVLEELNIPVNPNGRVPAIEDPNTGITLWESGAIVEYLVETYDKDHAISYGSPPEKWSQKQWTHFQMSGQGPYFGQLVWFKFYHSEKNLTSVIDRYKTELRRVISVLDLHLSKTGKPYLVGDKVTFADLMFIPWNLGAERFMDDSFPEEWQKKYPKAWDWHQRLTSRASVKKALEIQAKAKAEGK
ncbi:Glutathione S-transferase-like protein OpS6 [Fulvia fulva]|nr:Glutathione S-transferase-like protein OpS6 [Fulvia fulva]KAK4621197.1 Glutathione S-transferase-like protein OpS6 [Fulvia fulva]WPV17113.1 Glutathione S-transferase-like protein OpS6 [Fulvia fulva]WPV32027.1 Glutathione S-transferase-like protein OpS6 [Fulvia fulva]